jgi:hypothetical protein
MSDEELQSDGKHWYRITIDRPQYLTKDSVPWEYIRDLAAKRQTHRKWTRLKCVVQGTKVVDVLRNFCEQEWLLFHEWNFETRNGKIPRTMEADLFLVMQKNTVLNNTTVDFVRLDDKHRLWTTQSNTDENLRDCIDRYCHHFKIDNTRCRAWTFDSADEEDLRFCRVEAEILAKTRGLDHLTIVVSHKPLDKVWIDSPKIGLYQPTTMSCPVWLAEARDWLRRRFMAFCMRSVPRLVKDRAPDVVPSDLMEHICHLSI